jgi:hypothetical protein
MQPQHPFDTHRRTARPVGLGIDRLDDGYEVRPRHDPGHLVEKSLAAGGLAILLKRDLGKCRLLYGGASSSVLRSP